MKQRVMIMNIELNKKDKKQFLKLLEAKENNIVIADMLFDFYQNDFSKLKINNENDLYHCFLDTYGIDGSNQEDIEITTRYIKENIKMLDTKSYKSNPYFKNVKPTLCKIGKYKLCLDKFFKNQPFAYDDVVIDENDYYIEKYCIGAFKEEFECLAISYKDEIWMNITPNEINTMASLIEKAHGNVLVYGLGLGYFPYMISLKDNVNHITIIENDSTIIDIFNEHIFPFFPYKDKITIIKMNAIEYERKNKEKYDFCFVDLWHNPEDGLPLYLTFKKMEKDTIEYSYWLEVGIKAMYRRLALIVLEEVFNGAKEDNFKHSENEIDDIINDIYFKNKNVSITSYEDILNFINL